MIFHLYLRRTSPLKQIVEIVYCFVCIALQNNEQFLLSNIFEVSVGIRNKQFSGHDEIAQKK